jgi:ATP-dependent RNA helicase RhlE
MKRMTFMNFELSRPLLQAVAELGFISPTPVQMQAIPALLEGRDVVGTAQTGTGKTVAFLLPSMQRLLIRPGSSQVRMLVLAPTRELTLQIAEEAERLSSHTSLRVAAIYGGAPIGRQTSDLRQGADIVIATPGRLMDHMRRGNVRFDELEILVLDEADRMLDMGFFPDIEAIVSRTPESRQTLLFSATMPQAILSISYRFMHNPVRIEIATARPPEAIMQVLYPVPKHLKTPLVVELLKDKTVESALIFTRTKQDAGILTRKLGQAGLSVDVIHGDFAQKQRLMALERFRNRKRRILVATNIASRGLDIDGISHVINFDVPDHAEEYVHRIGRTARVDAEGVAWTLVTPEDEPLISSIEYLLDQKIERRTLAGFDYDVPAPDWAKPSPQVILRRARLSQSATDRWKSLTR